MNIPALLKRHKNVLDFTFVNVHERMQMDFNLGIKDLKVFQNRLTFVGKSYGDPHAEILFSEIRSVEIVLTPKGKIASVIVKAPLSKNTYYEHAPGPDL